MSNPTLAGKVVIVTGAAGAIGAATCLLMAARGARIAAVDRPGCDFTDLARQIAPECFIGVKADVTGEPAVKLYVERSVAAFGGRIDIFFNNAGIVGPAAPLVAFLASDDAAYINGSVHSVDGALNALRAT